MICYTKCVAILMHKKTSASLYHKLAESAPSALIDVLDHWKKGNSLQKNKMIAKVTMQRNFLKKRLKLDWSLSAAQLERNIRAFNPWPISFLQLTDEQGNEQP